MSLSKMSLKGEGGLINFGHQSAGRFPGKNKGRAEQFQRGCDPPKISTLTEEAADTVLKATIYSSLHTSVDWSCVHVKGFYISSVDPFFCGWGEIDAETFVVVVHCHGQHLL